MVIGGGLGAAAGYGIAAGYLSFNFAFATPFVAVGSFVGGYLTMGMLSETGPIAIPFIILGAKIGEVALGEIGRFGGGIIYDISEYIHFNSYLHSIESHPLYSIDSNIWQYGF